MGGLLTVLSKALRAILGIQFALALGCALAGYLFYKEAGRLNFKVAQSPARLIRPGSDAGEDFQEAHHLIEALGISAYAFAGLALLHLISFIELFKLASQIRKIRGSKNPPV